VICTGALLAALLVLSTAPPARAQDTPPAEPPPAAAAAARVGVEDAAPLEAAQAVPSPDAADAPADLGEPGAGEAVQPGAQPHAPAPPSDGGAAAPAEGADPLAATPGEKALYDRLLGGGEPTETAPATGAPPAGLGIDAPSVPGWLWVVGILGGAGLLFLRSRSLKALRGPDAIEVLSRSQLGKDGSLAVVEVAEADGEKRRLLVGFGSGAPRLVADLGRPFPDEPQPVAASLVERAAAAGPRSPVEEPSPAVEGAPEAPPRANAASAWARAMRDAGGAAAAPAPQVTPAAAARLERRHDLIQEVLAEREDDDVRGVVG
jgi:hypothetical protein